MVYELSHRSPGIQPGLVKASTATVVELTLQSSVLLPSLLTLIFFGWRPRAQFWLK
jgi:hypothetical protein